MTDMNHSGWKVISQVPRIMTGPGNQHLLREPCAVNKLVIWGLMGTFIIVFKILIVQIPR